MKENEGNYIQVDRAKAKAVEFNFRLKKKLC